MNSILTLITAPDKVILDAGMITKARQGLASVDATVAQDITWLADGIACDIAFTGPPPDSARQAVVRALGPAPIDVVAQSAKGRRKAVLVADMDSTIITVETVDLLASRAGVGGEVARITERSMRGELDFTDSLRARVAMLAGLDEAVLRDIRDTALTITPGARTLIATMRANHAHTVLVSGGFTIFTAAIAARVGFDAHQGNRLGMTDGRIDGTLGEPVINRGGKRIALEAIAKARGVSLDQTMALGDGANDLDMLACAGLGIAFRAKPIVAASAPARIDHGDLTAALYIQGYRGDEFVDA